MNLRGLSPSGSRGRRLSGLGYPSASLILNAFYKFIMKILLEMNGEEREIEIEDDITGEELIKKLGLFIDATLLIVDGEPIPCKEKIKGKHVKIINVASRG